MMKDSIPPEAWAALEVGDIPAAVLSTATANPNLCRLEVCALLGEAVAANPVAAIPVAKPLRWDFDVMQTYGVEDNYDVIKFPERVNKALQKPFPESTDKTVLRNVPANQGHQGSARNFGGNKPKHGRAYGCFGFFLLGAGMFFFFPGWGFIAMGLGILLLSYNFQQAASKESDDFELIKSAKPVYPSQAQTGSWNVVCGKIKSGAPVSSVVADGSLAYVHVMVQKQVDKEIHYVESGGQKTGIIGEYTSGGHRVISWRDYSFFHVRRELPQAWLEAEGHWVRLLGSDYESLVFLEGELPEKEDYQEQNLRLARQGRGESGVKTRRIETHTARAFLLDDGLHVANPQAGTMPQPNPENLPPVIGADPSPEASTQSGWNPTAAEPITVTTRCLAVDDDVWAAGYVWDDGQGGRTMGAHLYQDEATDSNILFLNDHDWQAQVASSEEEVGSSSNKKYIFIAISVVLFLAGILIIAFDLGPKINEAFKAIIEKLDE